ncbi:MAG: hypothetical protein Q7J34_08095 [Bacteroidales bacterium]|nr:hypothetical protein [Bacteroidales bacterium]
MKIKVVDSLMGSFDTSRIYVPRNLYLVTMEIQPIKPSMSILEEAGYIESRLLPGYLYIDSLRKAGVPIFGGIFAIKSGCAFIIQAENNVALRNIMNLNPLNDVALTTVTPLVSFGENLFRQQENLQALKEKMQKAYVNPPKSN